MTKDERIVNFKYRVLQHAREHKNITDTCKKLNLFRTIYYKWSKRFSQLGYLGLPDKDQGHSQSYIALSNPWAKKNRQ